MNKFGIIAGDGDLPDLIIEALKLRQTEIFVVPITNHNKKYQDILTSNICKSDIIEIELPLFNLDDF